VLCIIGLFMSFELGPNPIIILDSRHRPGPRASDLLDGVAVRCRLRI